MALASVERVLYRGYVQFEDMQGEEARARQAYHMFRQHNLRATQKIHPLFARGDSKPLTLKVDVEHLAAVTACGSPSPTPSPSLPSSSSSSSPAPSRSPSPAATVLDARLSRVSLVAVCKKKLLVFIAPTGRQVRVHCHCFCLPSKQELEMVLRALPIHTPVMRLPEKGHRRTRSVPVSLSLTLSSPTSTIPPQPADLAALLTTTTTTTTSQALRSSSPAPSMWSSAGQSARPLPLHRSSRLPLADATATSASASASPTALALSSPHAAALPHTPAFRPHLYRFDTMYDLSQLDSDDACSSAAPSAPQSAHGSTLHLELCGVTSAHTPSASIALSSSETDDEHVGASASALNEYDGGSDSLFFSPLAASRASGSLDGLDGGRETDSALGSVDHALHRLALGEDGTTNACEHCQAVPSLGVCCCRRAALYVGAEEVAVAEGGSGKAGQDLVAVETLWNALTRTLEHHRPLAATLCVSSAGVRMEDRATGRPAFSRVFDDVRQASVVDGFVCLVYCMPGRPRALVQFFQMPGQGRDIVSFVQSRPSALCF